MQADALLTLKLPEGYGFDDLKSVLSRSRA